MKEESIGTGENGEMVLGTFAYCGSGQDTLADGFCEHLGFVKYSMGDVIRNVAKSRGLPMQREVLQKIRMEYDLKYGRDFVANRIVEWIQKSEMPMNHIIITGIRTVEERRILHEQLGMKLVFVYADEHIRYQRMLRRKEEKDERTLNDLQRCMKKENELFDYSLLEEHAQYTFNFNMSLEEYKSHEEKIIEEFFIKIAKEEEYERTI